MRKPLIWLTIMSYKSKNGMLNICCQVRTLDLRPYFGLTIITLRGECNG